MNFALCTVFTYSSNIDKTYTPSNSHNLCQSNMGLYFIPFQITLFIYVATVKARKTGHLGTGGWAPRFGGAPRFEGGRLVCVFLRNT